MLHVLASLVFASAWPAAAPAFDKLLLKDGRLIEGKIVPGESPDVVVLQIRGAEVPVPSAMIEKSWVEDLEGYVPQTKQEEDYLKKGFVLFEGNWMSRKRREDELKKRADADKKFIEDAKKRQDWRNHVTRETKHFTIHSNLEDEWIDTYETLLEAYYKNFNDFWGIKLTPGEKKGKPEVSLYRNLSDFYRVTGVPYGVLGFFMPPTFELHLAHHPDDPEYGIDVLFHEGNHLLTQMMAPKVFYPSWMNEGMAEYYGSIEVDEQGGFHVGRQQDGRIVAMNFAEANGKGRQLRDVLLTEKQAFDALDYSYAWSFVHFLMQSPEYAKPFQGFFGNFATNRDVKFTNQAFGGEYQGATMAIADLPSVVTALEKRLGKSLEQLDREWRAWMPQAYGEMRPQAYYDAARIELNLAGDEGPDVAKAAAFYQKAIDLGLQSAKCFRDYAELLRKGGVREARGTTVGFKPDPEKAWEMVQRAIALDPVDPRVYCEAAGILIMDSPIQDLDRAADLAATALAIAGSRDIGTKLLHDELMSLIEPAREKARKRAEEAAALAKLDRRIWFVMPFYYEGQPVPEQIKDLSTADLRELIRSGVVKANDSVFQSFYLTDAETGEPIPGENPWDKAWVALKDVPDFSEDLAAAAPAAENAEPR